MPGAGSLIALLAITYAAAAVGAIASADAPSFYQSLAKPAWAPPAGIFGPVWSVLYTLIAVSAFLVVRDLGWRRARGPVAVYLVQLGVNALWTWIFFAWRSGLAALVDIVLLLGLVIVMLVLFWRVRPVAGALILPYLAWVTFASALTLSVWVLNPGLL
ncbi:MAG: tryptophan-rich sensory protein [Coriobacteriales bacterium]|nr:tryptophan-rich sensory protein [Coriobacteriales bacterium]